MIADSRTSTRRTIARCDPEWPERLDELVGDPAPDLLHLLGQPLDVRRAVAIVGSRTPTSTGLDVAESFAIGLAEAGFTVVSGLARGIDAAAHRGALKAGGRTVAVLGCGCDQEYPWSNRKLRREIIERGTLVSELDDGVPPAAFNFPRRNRIIAGLSEAVIFVEGRINSGGRITARIAVDSNRLVLAVPGSARNEMAEGPNDMIRTSQASAVTSLAHVFEELAPGIAWVGDIDPAAHAPAIDDREQMVLALFDERPLRLPELVARVDRPMGDVAMTLARLETKGLVARARAGYAITMTGRRARAAGLPLDD